MDAIRFYAFFISSLSLSIFINHFCSKPPDITTIITIVLSGLLYHNLSPRLSMPAKSICLISILSLFFLLNSPVISLYLPLFESVQCPCIRDFILTLNILIFSYLTVTPRLAGLIAFTAIIMSLSLPVIMSGFYSGNFFQTSSVRMLSIPPFVALIFMLEQLGMRTKPRLFIQLSLCASCFILSSFESICFYMTGKGYDISFWSHFNLNTLLHGGLDGYKFKLMFAIAAVLLFSSVFGMILRYNATSKYKMRNNSLLLRCAIILLCITTLSKSQFPPLIFARSYKHYRCDRIMNYSESATRHSGLNPLPTLKNDIRSLSGKNLVYIYIESMENTFTDDRFFPGLTPELRRYIDHEAVYFSNISQAPNSTCTFGGLFASLTGGVLSRFHVFNENPGDENSGLNINFADKLPSYPYVLHKAGYHQVFIKGADLQFASNNLLLKREMFDEMYCYKDYTSTITDPELYGIWGMRDKAVFQAAYREYVKLSKSGKPFNLTLLTVDSHPPDGYPVKYGLKYKNGKSCLLNAIHDTDSQLGMFIEKLKKLDSWKDTVIVISADHLAMRSTVYNSLTKNPDRKLVFMALNTGTKANIDTPGATFDIAPTVLDLLQVKHNCKFPMGQSLLGKPDPKRLDWNHNKSRIWESYCSYFSNQHDGIHFAQLVAGDSPSINLGRQSLPVITGINGKQQLPTRGNLFIIELDQSKKILNSTFIRIANTDDVTSMMNNKLHRYIVLGISSSISRVIFNKDIPVNEEEYSMIYGQPGNWIQKTSKNPESLRVEIL